MCIISIIFFIYVLYIYGSFVVKESYCIGLLKISNDCCRLVDIIYIYKFFFFFR